MEGILVMSHLKFLRNLPKEVIVGTSLGLCCTFIGTAVKASEIAELHLTSTTEYIELVEEIESYPIEIPTTNEAIGINLVSDSFASADAKSIGAGVSMVESISNSERSTSSINTNVPNHIEGCRSWNITYMDYKAVTARSSAQYQLLNSDLAHTDKITGIRMIDDRYCIALGSYYTSKVGQKVNLVFENGTVIKCILGDCKSDKHTDPSHRFHSVDGSVAEFIVDSEYFESTKQWKGLGIGTISKVLLVD